MNLNLLVGDGRPVYHNKMFQIMRHSFLVLLIGLLFLSFGCGTGVSPVREGGGGCTMSGTWATIDDFIEFTSGATFNATCGGVVSDRSGALYSTGYILADSSGTQHWIIRKSVDSGTTWSTISDFQAKANKHSNGLLMALTQEGTLISAGQVYLDSTNKYHWYFRNSADGGATWNTLNTFQYASSYNTFFGGFARLVKDASGNLFVTGYVAGSDSKYRMVIRKSVDSGVSWTTVRDYQYASNQHSGAYTLLVLPDGRLLAIGYGTDSSAVAHGLIFSSSDGGTTWSSFADYQLNAGKDTYLFDAALDQSGNLVVVGTAKDTGNVDSAIVIRTSNNGSSWEVLNQFQLTSGLRAGNSYIRRDVAGNLHVGGYVYSDATTTTRNWILRKGSPTGDDWGTLDQLPTLKSNNQDNIYGMYEDESHNLYACGYYRDAAGFQRYLLKKLSCNPNVSASAAGNIKQLLLTTWNKVSTWIRSNF